MSPPAQYDVLGLLAELGLVVEPGGVEIISGFEESAYVHHTRMPVAVVGYSLASPGYAKAKFPGITLLQLVRKRSSMDGGEAAALAAVCGAQVAPPFWGNPEPFVDHLLDVVAWHDLGDFFVMEKLQPEGTRLSAFRPRGFDWSDPMRSEIPGVIDQWRKNYRVLSASRQIMVATIMQLYMQRDDRIWMVRVPKKWSAVEGIEILRDAGCLPDWAKLVALYPGW